MDRSHVAKEVNIPKQNVPFNSKDLKYIHQGTAQSFINENYIVNH